MLLKPCVGVDLPRPEAPGCLVKSLVVTTGWCYWHLVARGQSCNEIFYSVQPSLQQRIITGATVDCSLGKLGINETQSF